MAKRKLSDSHMQSWWRRAVLSVWGERCARCGYPGVQCHHVIKRRHALLRNDWRNGIPLCPICHMWAETLQGRTWVYMQVDTHYLMQREAMNIKDYLQEHGITRREFDERTLAELKRVVENGL